MKIALESITTNEASVSILRVGDELLGVVGCSREQTSVLVALLQGWGGVAPDLRSAKEGEANGIRWVTPSQEPPSQASTAALVGRISNAADIRRALNLPSDSNDAELVASAYRCWDATALDRLEGSFALMVMETESGRLVFSSDHLGSRRLWYAHCFGGLLVSSDPHPLLRLLNPKPEPNAQALAYLLTLGYVPSPLTMWTGVQRLAAGDFGTWTSDRGLKIRAYWRPPELPADILDSDGRADELGALIEAAAERSVDSTGSTGLLLSAGLDSASIALACARSRIAIQPLTLQSPGVPSEATLAHQLAKHLGFDTRIETLEPDDFDGTAEVVAKAYTEPQAFFAQLTNTIIGRTASHREPVWLTGHGAEEVFGGYDWYPGQPVRSRSYLQRMRLFSARSSFAAAATDDADHQAFGTRSPLHSHLLRMRPSMLLPAEVNRWLAPSGIRFREEDLLAPLANHFCPCLPLRRALQRVDLMTMCADGILPKLAASSRAFGLQYRSPLLERSIIDWALTRPESPREYQQRKPLLQDYLRHRVPPAVLRHPKHGFNPRWHRLMNPERSQEIIRRGPWLGGMLSPSAVQPSLAPGQKYWEQRLWTLRNLSAWGQAWGVG